MEVKVLSAKGKATSNSVSLSDKVFGIEPNDHAIYLDVKQHLGANLVRVIKWYLDINEPFGLRHKVAHGFIVHDLCNVTMSSMLIWLTLLVSSLIIVST